MTQQLTDDDLTRLTPAQIVEALHAGQLDAVIGKSPEYIKTVEQATDGLLDDDTIHKLTRFGRHDLIAKANAEGRIKYDHNTTQEPA